MQHRTLVAGAAALLALACCTTGAAAACLDLPPVIDSDSVPAFMSGVLDYFSYPTAFPELNATCGNDCVDFQKPFTALAKSLGAEQVVYANGAKDHLNAMVVQTPSNVYLVFRGTEWASVDPVDTDQNLKINMTDAALGNTVVGVHAGMSQDLYEVLPDLVAALESMGAGTDRNLIITGHSLGGSLSNLAAANLAADGFNVSAVYTWAAGRVGDDRFAQLYRDLGLQGRTLRFNNQGDTIPLLSPPARTGYTHVGRLVRVSNSSCDAPVDTEEVNYCADGLAPDTASQPGVCQATILPFFKDFCATPIDKLTGKDALAIAYNQFMYALWCGSEAQQEQFFSGLDQDPSWCCAMEYSLATDGLADMVEAVGVRHGLLSHLKSANTCITDQIQADTIAACMSSNQDAMALLEQIVA